MYKTILKVCLIGVFILGLTASVYGEPVLNPANGHYYQLFEDSVGLVWGEANDAATNYMLNGMRGHLATITSASEEAFLLATFPIIGGPHIWLGGFQSANSASMSSGWHWVTNEVWSYTNWDSIEPNDDNPPEDNQENCLEYTNGVAAWNDESCYSERDYYLVEYEPNTVGNIYYNNCPASYCPLSNCFIPVPGMTGCFNVGPQLTYCGCTFPCLPPSCVVHVPIL
jgi:hypothetical protein